jgi:GntR family transcriptional regulator
MFDTRLPRSHVHPVFRDSPIPRYVQLADLFRQRIARGTWVAGQQLPTLEKLVREFDVARVTVRQAMNALEREGLVLAQRGRGTFVTGRPSRVRELRLETSLKDLAEVYRDDKPKLIEESSAIPALDEKDGRAAPGYRFMRRIHARSDDAYCVISIYLDERVFRRAPKRFRRETVIPVLLDLKVPIARAHQTLRIGTADVETAAHLGIPVNAPTAEVRRVCRAPDGTVTYLSEVIYRGDYIVLEMDLKP